MKPVAWVAARTNVCLFEVGDGIGMASDHGILYERPAGFITVSEQAADAGEWHLEWRLHDIQGQPTNKIARWTGNSGARDLRWYLPPPEYVIDEQP